MPDSRDPLLDDLAAAWRARDPMPDDLPDRILTALAMADLDADHELLTLTQRSESLLGARSSSDDRTLIEFQADGVQVLLRIALANGHGGRIDGWVEPGGLRGVTLLHGDDSVPGQVTSGGRFEVSQVPPGLARLELELTDGDSTRRLRSPHFEI